MKKVLATAAFLFASSSYAAQNLTGLWTIHSKINDTESNVGCKLVVTDNKITGTCNFQNKDRQVTGSVDKDKVTLQYDADYNGTAFTLIYTGTLDNSGKIAGIVRLQPFNVDGLFTAAPGPPPQSQSADTGWRKYPARDPHMPGFVAAKELPDGANPPVNADGNFILGPTHTPAPKRKRNPAYRKAK
jgi:hypothetical protein